MPDARELLLSCLPRLRRYARALTGERSSADDLVQDTRERGWSRLAQWRAGGDMRQHGPAWPPRAAATRRPMRLSRCTRRRIHVAVS